MRAAHGASARCRWARARPCGVSSSMTVTADTANLEPSRRPRKHAAWNLQVLWRRVDCRTAPLPPNSPLFAKSSCLKNGMRRANRGKRDVRPRRGGDDASDFDPVDERRRAVLEG